MLHKTVIARDFVIAIKIPGPRATDPLSDDSPEVGGPV